MAAVCGKGGDRSLAVLEAAQVSANLAARARRTAAGTSTWGFEAILDVPIPLGSVAFATVSAVRRSALENHGRSHAQVALVGATDATATDIPPARPASCNATDRPRGSWGAYLRPPDRARRLKRRRRHRGRASLTCAARRRVAMSFVWRDDGRRISTPRGRNRRAALGGEATACAHVARDREAGPEGPSVAAALAIPCVPLLCMPCRGGRLLNCRHRQSGGCRRVPEHRSGHQAGSAASDRGGCEH